MQQTALRLPASCTLAARTYSYSAQGQVEPVVGLGLIAVLAAEGLLVLSPDLVPQKLIAPPRGCTFAASPVLSSGLGLVAVTMQCSASVEIFLVDARTLLSTRAVVSNTSQLPTVLLGVPGSDVQLVGSYGNTVFALALQAGSAAVAWSFTAAGPVTSLTLSDFAADMDTMVAVGTDTDLYGITLDTGLIRQVWPGPLYQPGHVIGADGTFIFMSAGPDNSKKNSVVAVSVITGDVVWTLPPNTCTRLLGFGPSCVLFCEAAAHIWRAQRALVAVSTSTGLIQWTAVLGACSTVADVVVGPNGLAFLQANSAAGTLQVSVLSNATGLADWTSSLPGSSGALVGSGAGTLAVLAVASASSFLYSITESGSSACPS